MFCLSISCLFIPLGIMNSSLLLFLATTLCSSSISSSKTMSTQNFLIRHNDSSPQGYEWTMGSMESETKHHLMDLRPWQFVVFQSLMGANLLVGNLFRSLLLKHAWKEGLHDKPINAMTGIVSIRSSYLERFSVKVTLSANWVITNSSSLLRQLWPINLVRKFWALLQQANEEVNLKMQKKLPLQKFLLQLDM